MNEDPSNLISINSKQCRFITSKNKHCMGFGILFSFSSRQIPNMLINGKAFEGTFDYEYTDGRFKNVCAGNISCISEFRPVRFTSARMIYKFLHSLYRYHLCCFLTGTHVLFTSGCLDSFDGMSVFIAMTDAPLLYFIFQKIHSPNLLLDDFTFNLVHVDEHDIFHYIVSSEDFKMPVTILGIDTTNIAVPCRA